MEKFKVSFEANNQQLKSIGTKHASDTYADIEATFVLGEKWTDMDTVSAVWWNDFVRVATVLDSQSKCIVPHEVLTRKGCVRVNLVGSIVEGDELITRLTSYSAEAVQVNEKIKLTGSETSEITPSQFEQFVAVVISEVEKVTGMTAQAETLPAGSQATARYENGILYLGIPQGIQGERGETGADGADGNGIASVVYNADYSLTLVFDNGERFTTPPIRGERGPAGADGRDGTDGADGVTPNISIGNVTTLEPSEDAYVTRRGTDDNPIFDFGIPKGEKGDTGDVSQEQLDAAVSDLKSEFAHQQEGNLPFIIVKDEYINADGNFAVYRGWDRTELIPVSKYYSITVKSSVQSSYNAFYKSDKTQLSRFIVTTSEQTLVIPSDAEYVAFSNSASGMDGLSASYITLVETNLQSVQTDVLTVQKDIYNDVKRIDLFSFPYQLGVVNSVIADIATNTLLEIAPSTSRMVIGPISFKKSITMDCDSSVQYKLFKRLSTDTSVSYFTDIYGAWQTSRHIEGCNEKTAEICNYYVQLAYTDNRVITSPKQLLSLFNIVESNDNPLGLTECSGIISGTGTPYLRNNGARRIISYKQTYDYDKVLLYCDNSNIRTGVLTGADVYASASDTGLSFGCKALNTFLENVFWFQDYTNNTSTSIAFKDYATFEELYDFLGLHVETINYDNDHITGNQLTDAHLIVEASTEGNIAQEDIFSDGVFLNDNGNIKFAHVPSLQIYGEYAYVVFLCDRTNTYEMSPYTEIDLAKIRLSDNTVEYTTIAKSGSYGGITFDGRCSYPASILSGNNLYIYFSGTVNSVQALCCAVYDLSTDTFTTSICNVVDNGNTYIFNTTNFDRYIGGKYGIQPLGYEIGICNPSGSNGTYYTTLSSGANGQIKCAILKTVDFINWSVFDVLPFEYGADCECVSLYSNGLLYMASRHSYTDCTTKLFKYDISTKKVVDNMQVSSTASRPTLFYKDSAIMASIPMTTRRTMQLIYLNSLRLRDSRLVLNMYSWLGLAYNAILQNGDDVYFAIQTNRSGTGTYEDYPKIYFGKTKIDL